MINYVDFGFFPLLIGGYEPQKVYYEYKNVRNWGKYWHWDGKNGTKQTEFLIIFYWVFFNNDVIKIIKVDLCLTV